MNAKIVTRFAKDFRPGDVLVSSDESTHSVVRDVERFTSGVRIHLVGMRGGPLVRDYAPHKALSR